MIIMFVIISPEYKIIIKHLFFPPYKTLIIISGIELSSCEMDIKEKLDTIIRFYYLIKCCQDDRLKKK